MAPRQISPANAWCFTLNNWTPTEYEFLSSLFLALSHSHFYIIGKEVGENGTPHLQGYIALRETNKKFRPLPKLAVMRVSEAAEGNAVNAMHFERAKGSQRQNYFYCSKDGDFVTNIPKPKMNSTEAKAVWEAEYEPGANGAQREEAALTLLAADFDIMKVEFKAELQSARQRESDVAENDDGNVVL